MKKQLRRRRRDPSEKALERRRPPHFYTLYSKDVRIDLLVAPPRVHRKEKHVRQPFDRPRAESSFHDQPVYVHYFPTKVRISWISNPQEPVLFMKNRDVLVESVRQLGAMPRGDVYLAALEGVESYVHGHPSQREKHVDYDVGSRGVNISWQAPPRRHVLSSGSSRVAGQLTPQAVKLRIKMLIRQAETSSGFQAQSAREKAESLIREYRLSEDEVRSLQAERRGEGFQGPSLEGGQSSRRLEPKRDKRRARFR